jgi:Na+/proline symporter/nitrogen-specific signal transduction histidine kinase
MPFNILVLACILYVALLFVLAAWAEGRSGRVGAGFLRSPLIYPLSLSIYCTAWTFYGAVGYAARSGLEFVTIYLGPTLVFVGWWWILRKLVRIGRVQRVTSIADLISSRFGKSNTLGVLVTLIAVVATTPYIALQLQSVTQSFAVFASQTPEGWDLPGGGATAIWLAGGLALFTILFGTRNLASNEQHHGIVTAIAFEAAVKLAALLAVGVFVVWGLGGGPSAIAAKIAAVDLAAWQPNPGRWTALIFVSAAAVITLPRMFQVMVVENIDEAHMARASWAFPAYLFLMSLFILPIAVVGMDRLPNANPDMLVLILPLTEGQGALAMLAFLGGFSSATSMVIVETIALATMLSNHIIMPAWLWVRPRAAMRSDLRAWVLRARRISIIVILGLGLAYFRLSGGSEALAAIGLIAFVGMAQVLPSLLGGIFWRGATGVGAFLGMVVGLAIWAYTLFLPSFGVGAAMPAHIFTDGLFGIAWLRPDALFGSEGMDPLVHSILWSISANTALFALASLCTFPNPVERVQGAAFVNVFDRELAAERLGWVQGQAEPEALLAMAQRIIGEDGAISFFETAARDQGKEGFLPDLTADFLSSLERRMAGSVGAATAHAMISQLFGRAMVTVEDLMAVASETAQILEYSTQLEAQQGEVTRTARALRDANEKLTAISVQKDAFLSQISHELRTPMTSIRAFSEILTEGDLPPAKVAEFGRVIHGEALRLTRLLDDLLDLSVLENGTVQLNIGVARLDGILDRALAAASQIRPERSFDILRDPFSEEIFLRTDEGRLVQVFINLISNARKYCDAAHPSLRIAVRQKGAQVVVDFIDNGTGIPKAQQGIIFEKFARLSDTAAVGGAGLGLAICREVMASLGGTVSYLPGQKGAAFRVSVPLRIGKAP